MKIGTKSVLFGAHCWFIHPWFVAWAWAKLYGWPWHPLLWLSFFVHDLGYCGKPNMDGSEGEEHPWWGANVVWWAAFRWSRGDHAYATHWGDLCAFHSRFLAKREGRNVSRLCYADKLALVLTPAWLYLPMVRATGEIREYMELAHQRTDAGEPKYASMQLSTSDELRWYLDVQEYLRRWVEEHRDGRLDTWTPNVWTSLPKES